MRLRNAKAAEEAAKRERIAIEEMIVSRFAAPDTGEGTAKDGALSISWKVTRKVDADALQGVWADLGANAQKAFRWKPEVDLKHLRALQELDPASYVVAAKYVTATPAKPSVTLKEEA